MTNVLTPTGGLRSQSDFSVYYHAARDVMAGKSPYESPAFFYPPLVAFVMTPFALPDYFTARWIWFLVSHGLLLLSGWLLWRSMGRGRIALACIAAVWAFGGAFKETLDVGQLSPVLVALLAIAYTQREQGQGISVGLGFALKYIPGIVLVPLLLQRRWRALSVFAGTVVLTLLTPWALIWRFFSGPKSPISAHYWMGTPALFSWSIPSSVLRILEPLNGSGKLPYDWQFGNVAANLHMRVSLEWISAGAAIVTLAAGLAALVWVCRGSLNAEQAPWAMVGLLSLSLAAAPVCWSHYQVLQYPGVAMLLISAIRLRAWGTTAATALCFALLHRLPEIFLVANIQAHQGWTAASPVTLYIWSSVTPLACLGLFALALMNVKRTAAGAERVVLHVAKEWRIPEEGVLSYSRKS